MVVMHKIRWCYIIPDNRDNAFKCQQRIVLLFSINCPFIWGTRLFSSLIFLFNILFFSQEKTKSFLS